MAINLQSNLHASKIKNKHQIYLCVNSRDFGRNFKNYGKTKTSCSNKKFRFLCEIFAANLLFPALNFLAEL